MRRTALLRCCQPAPLLTSARSLSCSARRRNIQHLRTTDASLHGTRTARQQTPAAAAASKHTCRLPCKHDLVGTCSNSARASTGPCSACSMPTRWHPLRRYRYCAMVMTNVFTVAGRFIAKMQLETHMYSAPALTLHLHCAHRISIRSMSSMQSSRAVMPVVVPGLFPTRHRNSYKVLAKFLILAGSARARAGALR